ncbi:hypothetical protein M405DRAFT_825085, partial [Rhizopogon salebrosus TDB-379]
MYARSLFSDKYTRRGRPATKRCFVFCFGCQRGQQPQPSSKKKTSHRDRASRSVRRFMTPCLPRCLRLAYTTLWRYSCATPPHSY